MVQLYRHGGQLTAVGTFSEQLKKKGGQIMTIEELKKVYESIPPTSPINRARRAAIMQQILKLMEGGK